MNKRIRIKQDPSRYLLSDVLPFEIPISISNRGFVHFIIKNKISFSFEDERLAITIKQSDKTTLKTILSVFSILFQQKNLQLNENQERGIIFIKFGREIETIPYFFKISSGTGKVREISYVHPLAQVIAMAFNERYKELILNYCAKSNFTIRAPRRIAKTRFCNDYSHFLSKVESENSSKIEEIGKEYETIKSYYVYYRYSNIYKFYESNLHHKLERRFSKLSKIDISSCFDSIYTHSIAWAIYGKEQAKDNLIHIKDKTFPGNFDFVMQKMNYGETHGIVIGPEFSRVFAETILQRIDYDVEKELDSSGYKNSSDYAILRFVDDYFVFYNDPKIFEKIKEILVTHLRGYKLFLNTAKESTVERPHITSITIAKENLTALIQNSFSGLYYIQDKASASFDFSVPYIKTNNFIKTVKSFIYQNNVKYGEVCNFFLSVLEKNINKLLKQWLKYASAVLKRGNEDDKKTIKKKAMALSKYCFEPIVDVVFFILSMDVSINAAIIMSRIINSIMVTIKTTRCRYSFARIPQTEFYRRILYYIESSFKILNSGNNEKRTFVLHLLNLAAELEDGYYIEPSILRSFVEQKDIFDYLSIVVVLRYIKNIKRYDDIKKIILNKIDENAFTDHKRYAISPLLLFDLITCPYIERKVKENLFTQYQKTYSVSIPTGISSKKCIDFIEANRLSFTCWNWTSFSKELAYKRADIVY